MGRGSGRCRRSLGKLRHVESLPPSTTSSTKIPIGGMIIHEIFIFVKIADQSSRFRYLKIMKLRAQKQVECDKFCMQTSIHLGSRYQLH